MERMSIAVFSYQPIVKEALLRKIGTSDHFSIIGATSALDEAMDVAVRLNPAVYVVDCGLQDRGLSTLRQLRKLSPKMKVVLFTGIENAEHAVIALDGGAAGYISSACAKIDVLAALELISSGQTFISPHIAARVIGQMRATSEERQQAINRRMNMREEQIAKYLVLGWTNRAIAERLGLTEKTIKHYMSNLMQKFDAKNRLELAMSLPKTPDSRPFIQ